MAFAGAQLALATFCRNTQLALAMFCRHTAGTGLIRAPWPTMCWEPLRATLLSGEVHLSISSSQLFWPCHEIVPEATTLEGQLAADETATNKLLFGFCHSNMEQLGTSNMLGNRCLTDLGFTFLFNREITSTPLPALLLSLFNYFSNPRKKVFYYY